MATIYIHIGAPKSATSTLQSILALKAKKLIRHGVLYPANCRRNEAHHVLVCDLIEKFQRRKMPDFWYGDFPRGQGWRNLAEEIDDHAHRTDSVVLSSELFFGQTANIRRVRTHIDEYLPSHTFKVVVYLRRQDQLYSSFYNQEIKGARQWSSSSYELYETHKIFQYDYFELLKLWGDAFGDDNILVRPFEVQQWPDGDIVKDFCDVAGIVALRSGRLKKNESLGPNQLCVKKCLNRVGYDKALNDSVLRLIKRLLSEESIANTLYVDPGVYRRHRSRWIRTNQKLSESYFHGKPFFRETVPDVRALKSYKVDRIRLGEYVRSLVFHFGKGRSPELRSTFARGALLLVAEQGLWSSVGERQRADLVAWA